MKYYFKKSLALKYYSKSSLEGTSKTSADLAPAG
jgi:hypothetical protein